MRSLVIRLLMIAGGLIVTAAAIKSEEPEFYFQALQAMWMVIAIGVTYFWYRERERQIAVKQASATPAEVPDEPEEELLMDPDNGILSALVLGDKEGMAIFSWMQASGWQVGSANKMYSRIRYLQEQNYIVRTNKAYKITEEGRNRLLRDRARRLGTEVHTTNR